MDSNTDNIIAPLPIVKWWLRVTYNIANLEGWSDNFIKNIPLQRDAGIETYKVTWKRRKSPQGGFAYKVKLHARVIDRQKAEAFMSQPQWRELAKSPSVGMELSTITNAWHPLHG